MKKEFEGPANILRRILAFIIDILILNLTVFYPFQALLSDMVPLDNFNEAIKFMIENESTSSTLLMVTIAMAVLAISYFSLLEWKFSQSIGKMFTKLYVVSETKELRLWQAVLRSLYFIPFFPFIILVVVDPIFMAINKEGKRLSEIMSKTKVVQIYNL